MDNTREEIVLELVNFFGDLANEGHISGYGPTHLSIGNMRDFVECDCFTEALIKNLNGETDRETVMDTVFNIMDENDFIDGDISCATFTTDDTKATHRLRITQRNQI